MELILAILFVVLLVFNIVVSNFVRADRMKWHPVVLWGTNDRSYFYTPCIIKVNPKKTTTKKDAKVASAKKKTSNTTLIVCEGTSPVKCVDLNV